MRTIDRTADTTRLLRGVLVLVTAALIGVSIALFNARQDLKQTRRELAAIRGQMHDCNDELERFPSADR